MRMKIGALAVAGIMLAFGASASRAAIVETIINTDSDAAVGSIAFPTLTGDSHAGVLFSYGGFTQADITSISWTLDPTTDAVVMLGLNALRGDNPCPNDQPSCSNTTLSLSSTLATSGGTSALTQTEDTGIGASFSKIALAEVVHVKGRQSLLWALM